MLGFAGYLEFREKYFSIFMAAIYLGISSCALTLLSLMFSYFRGTDVSLMFQWDMGISIAGAVCQAFFSVMLSRGRPAWVWGLVGMFTLCLLVSLTTVGGSPPPFIYVLAIFSPLAGLYCLNSKRYREMLKFLAVLRQGRDLEKRAQAATNGIPKRTPKAPISAGEKRSKASRRK